MQALNHVSGKNLWPVAMQDECPFALKIFGDLKHSGATLAVERENTGERGMPGSTYAAVTEFYDTNSQ